MLTLLFFLHFLIKPAYAEINSVITDPSPVASSDAVIRTVPVPNSFLTPTLVSPTLASSSSTASSSGVVTPTVSATGSAIIVTPTKVPPTQVPKKNVVAVISNVPTPTPTIPSVIQEKDPIIQTVAQIFVPDTVFPDSFLRFEKSGQKFYSSDTMPKSQQMFLFSISGLWIAIGILFISWSRFLSFFRRITFSKKDGIQYVTQIVQEGSVI